MAAVLAGNTMWTLVLQGDTMTKCILLFLVSLSVISWSIALYKLIVCHIKIQELKAMNLQLKEIRTFKALFTAMKKIPKTLPGYFLSRCLIFLKDLLMIRQADNQLYAQSTGIDFLQMQVGQTIDEIVMQEESYISVLTVSAAVGPLLGLLGTVWGLVHAFIDISQKQSADIVTVAPGIAEALITTIAGLLVAIPAVILFYAVSNKVREIDFNISLLADKVVMIARNLVIDNDVTDQQMIHDADAQELV